MERLTPRERDLIAERDEWQRRYESLREAVFGNVSEVDCLGGLLSRTQAIVYWILRRHAGEVRTKRQLHNAICAFTNHADFEPQEKVVDVYICKIRAKLPPHLGVIQTVWGVGYRLVLPSSGKEIETVTNRGNRGNEARIDHRGDEPDDGVRPRIDDFEVA